MTPAPVAPLFVPGDRPERFAKAASSRADAVILDLEDAVDPEAKEVARANVVACDVSGKPVFVRVNAADTQWWERDLDAVSKARIDGVVLPKAESAEAVAALAGAGGGEMSVIVLVETVKGLFEIDTLARAPRVLCLAFGALDFGLDAGCEPSWEPLLLARSRLVLSSRMAGIAAPIDGVTPAIDDAALVAEEARRAAATGFGGKLVIHPKQVEPVLSAFRPDEEAIGWAGRVLAAASDGAAVQVDGRMVDRPLVEKARRIMATAGRPVD